MIIYTRTENEKFHQAVNFFLISCAAHFLFKSGWDRMDYPPHLPWRVSGWRHENKIRIIKIAFDFNYLLFRCFFFSPLRSRRALIELTWFFSPPSRFSSIRHSTHRADHHQASGATSYSTPARLALSIHSLCAVNEMKCWNKQNKKMRREWISALDR